MSEKKQRRALVGLAVESTYRQYKKRYGAPRLAFELNAQGIECSVNHVAELLRERGLRARNGKGFKYYPSVESYKGRKKMVVPGSSAGSVLKKDSWLVTGHAYAGGPDY